MIRYNENADLSRVVQKPKKQAKTLATNGKKEYNQRRKNSSQTNK